MAAISVVLFDLEGVLSYYDRDARVASLAASTGAPPEAVRHAIWGSGLEARADAGELDPDDYLRALGAVLGRAVSRDAWLASRRASITPNEAALALAQRVATRSHIAVLTNNSPLVTDYLDYLNPPVARLFGARIYSSAAFGAVKPAAQTYLGCVAQLGATPQATLFIDDSQANVTGALEAGLQARQFVDADSLAHDLERLGLIDGGPPPASHTGDASRGV
ncbi:HAD family hydrolase [Paraburkholderia lycopersici]|uniref:Putative hydrolase of the HAD superfamily n=1 Tax=Paraburkholderia lycopersici TaxID=416944 RepID=A0A1G6TI64_9BURK|nr:HAD family phosphatase [Paraburkholderia lycopersici]SDD28852.1 putative hydrolase of the HAD superfamily [Paraburkholderia lycopersici]